jgi:small multidrug resistance pump
MQYLYLAGAILFEIIGTTLMKFTDGFTRPVQSTGVIIFYLVSTIFMNLAIKYIDLTIVYAVWSGVGTAAIALLGFWYFKEPVTTVKVLSIFLIVGGVIGLNSKY